MPKNKQTLTFDSNNSSFNKITHIARGGKNKYMHTRHETPQHTTPTYHSLLFLQSRQQRRHFPLHVERLRRILGLGALRVTDLVPQLGCDAIRLLVALAGL